MDINTTAQQELFRQLSIAAISLEQPPRFNGYHIEELGLFINSLDKGYDEFESELSENIMRRSEGLGFILTHSLQTITKIGERVRQYQHENIPDAMELNPDLYKRNRHHEMNQFLDCQLEIIDKTTKLIEEKLDLVMNSGVFIPANPEAEVQSSPVLKNKIRSRLAKAELTCFLWWIVEAGIFDVGENLQDFIRFVEDNFQYYDKNKEGFFDLKEVDSTKSKLSKPDDIPKTEDIRTKLLEMLKETTMPPNNSILKKKTFKY